MHWEWIFHRSFFRQGCACEACRVLVDYTFAQQNAHRVMPEAYRPGNVSGPYEKAENAPGGPPAPSRPGQLTGTGPPRTFTGRYGKSGGS